METAIFGAGCFWGVEEKFRCTPGVVSTEVGYSGGIKENPTYEEVCSDKTEHAEVVKVEFDSNEITYEKLVEVFFDMHNPTMFNAQGFDVGSQYRSVIFYNSEEQRLIAEQKREDLDNSSKYDKPVVTLIEPIKEFYKAEEYHQKYLLKHGRGKCD